MTAEPRLLAPHYHGDGRRAMYRYINGETVKQVYVVDIRPGVTTAWHGHKHQSDYWIVLDGMLQVGLVNEAETEKREIWMNGANQQVLEIPPGWWHGYHNPGPGIVRMINMTTNSFNPDEPDELRKPIEAFENLGFVWGYIEMK
jgi:dTDP-4-dehydrorhamnose 3,5-epimerase-like enzyme